MKPEAVHAEPLAEQAVLGGILADPRQVAEVSALVKPEDFFEVRHQDIFAAAVALDTQGRPLDPMTVGMELKARGQLDRVGGLAYLAELDRMAPVAANAVEYARSVAEAATKRRLHAVLTEISRRNLQGLEPAAALAAEATAKLGEVGGRAAGKGLEAIKKPIERAIEKLEAMRNHQGGITGLPTGCQDLDNLLTGLHEGELIILAARPGQGKSAQAMQWAAHVGVREKKGVAVFSLEMPTEQLVMRMLSSEGRVNLKRLRQGGLSQLDEVRLSEAAGNLYEAPIYIDDSESLTPADVRAKVTRLKRQDPSLGLVVIDYLGLMRPDSRAESRQQEVGQISRSLKQLAKSLALPIIALCQMNRKIEERRDGRPMLSDLREAGDLEQDADVVLFLHNAKLEEGERPIPGFQPIDLICAKQRNGPIQDVHLVMHQEHVRFEPRTIRDSGPDAY